DDDYDPDAPDLSDQGKQESSSSDFTSDSEDFSVAFNDNISPCKDEPVPDELISASLDHNKPCGVSNGERSKVGMLLCLCSWLWLQGELDFKEFNVLMFQLYAGRMWCHCRMVYLPMSYLYGKRFVGPINATILSLRRELYTHPYHQIDWNQARYLCAKEDLYYPHPMIQDILWDSLHKIGEPLLMQWPFYRLRKKALSMVMEHIHYEDENTQYICLGPVNKVLNMICCWVDDPNSMANQLHLSRIKDYLWVAEDGMKMQVFYQGYNGSQLWDVAFAVQAILSTNLVDEYGSMLKKSHEFIKISQAS
ncbi:hypothetical protein HYC85_019238, partial [Camellia sinensis]